MGEEITELDWFDLIQGTDYEYYAQCDRPFVAGDLLCFTSYDESGNNIIVTTDLTDGDTDIYYPTDLGLDAYLEEICAYKDGLLLALSVQYTQDGNIANLYRTDPRGGGSGASRRSAAHGPGLSGRPRLPRGQRHPLLCHERRTLGPARHGRGAARERGLPARGGLLRRAPHPHLGGLLHHRQLRGRRAPQHRPRPALRRPPHRAEKLQFLPSTTPTTPSPPNMAMWTWSWWSRWRMWCRR